MCFRFVVNSHLQGCSSIEESLQSEEGRRGLSMLLSTFFYSMRVTATDDGTEKLPKRRYAEVISFATTYNMEIS